MKKTKDKPEAKQETKKEAYPKGGMESMLAMTRDIGNHPRFAQNVSGRLNIGDFARVANLPHWENYFSNQTKKSEVEGDVKLAFKSGFALRCAEEGLTPEQTTARAEEAFQALEKKAAAEGAMPFFSPVKELLKKVMPGVGGMYGDLGVAGLIGAPLLAGGAGGYALAKLRNAAETDDVDSLKLKTRLMRYRQMADNAERQSKLRSLQDQHPGELVQIS